MNSPVQRVTVWHLRWLFNKLRYVDRLRAGELREVIEKSNPASPEAHQPPGTLTETATYHENWREVARVHQYRLPNGEVKGLPDPKKLLINGVKFCCKEPPDGWLWLQLFHIGNWLSRKYFDLMA